MKSKTITKRSLVQQLRAKGLSARKAAKAVNVVFDSWKNALAGWEEVETPCGTLKAVRTHGEDRCILQRLRKVQTQELMYRVAKYPGYRRVVKLRPNLQLDLTPEEDNSQQLDRTTRLLSATTPPPLQAPVPETDEERRTRQLAGELLGCIADDRTMAQLRKAVMAHPREPGVSLTSKPGALLRRLQEFKDRGWDFSSVADLARKVSEHFWL